MKKTLARYLIKALIILLIIHLGYFVFGFFNFEGLAALDYYTEYYRFKFIDNVLASQVIIAGLFLLFFLIFLIKKYSRQNHSIVGLLKIGGVLLIVSFMSCSFFFSYNLGMFTKLRTDLPEKTFNQDKELLNALWPFLHDYRDYRSNEIFNPLNILYPKPYPVVMETDSTSYSDGYYTVVSRYYSADTLKMSTADFNAASAISSDILSKIGLDGDELKQRIIQKTIEKDSIEIIYKGSQVSPEYDFDICIFLMTKDLYIPTRETSIEKQQYQAAVNRYQLLYSNHSDSLLLSFQKLDTLLQKLNIEANFKPEKLTKDIFRFKKSNQVQADIDNYIDRKQLREKINSIEYMYYEPKLFHSSILVFFLSAVIGIWFFIFFIYIITNKKKLNIE